uniref:Uncharacterized protein n=1 Tax=Magallana gigas TaxID=29159 RepID=A0A8W8NQ86_MAGGI
MVMDDVRGSSEDPEEPIVRILRRKACQPQNVPTQQTKTEWQTNALATQQGIIEMVDDNAEYQELGHVSKPSIYDQPQRPQI